MELSSSFFNVKNRRSVEKFSKCLDEIENDCWKKTARLLITRVTSPYQEWYCFQNACLLIFNRIHLKTDGRIIGRYWVGQCFSSNWINLIWFADFTKVVNFNTISIHTLEEQIFSWIFVKIFSFVFFIFIIYSRINRLCGLLATWN